MILRPLSCFHGAVFQRDGKCFAIGAIRNDRVENIFKNAIFIGDVIKGAVTGLFVSKGEMEEFA